MNSRPNERDGEIVQSYACQRHDRFSFLLYLSLPSKLICEYPFSSLKIVVINIWSEVNLVVLVIVFPLPMARWVTSRTSCVYRHGCWVRCHSLDGWVI